MQYHHHRQQEASMQMPPSIHPIPKDKQLCSFSSPMYTNDHGHKNVCKTQEGACMIGCTNCFRGGKVVLRCFLCMDGVTNVIKKLVPPKSTTKELISSSATSISCAINWRDAGHRRMIPDSVSVDGKTRKVPIHPHPAHDNIFLWDKQFGCPCCADDKLPDRPRLPALVKAADNPTTILIEDLVHSDIDNECNKIESISIVEVVILKSVLSREDEMKFKSFDINVDDDGECIVYHSMPQSNKKSPSGIRVRCLLAPVDGKLGEYDAVSTMIYNEADECDGGLSSKARARDSYAACIQKVAPQPAAIKKRNKDNATSKQPNTATSSASKPAFTSSNPPARKKQKKGHLRKCNHNTNGGNRYIHLRNCRTGGAGAHANGQSLQAVQSTQASPNLVNAQSRDRRQCIQVAVRDVHTNLITQLPLVYAASGKKSKIRSFTLNPQKSPVILSSEAQGIDVTRELIQAQSNVLEEHHKFTRSRIITAFILESLEEHPILKEKGVLSISREARNNILNCFYETMYHINTKFTDSSPVSKPIDRFELSLSKYDVLEQVFFVEHGEDRGNIDRYLPGIILGLVRETRYERIYNISPFNDEKAIQVPDSYITSVPGQGGWNDDDYEEDCKGVQNVKQLHSEGIQHPMSLLGSRGTYNVMNSAVGNHIDNFGTSKEGSPRVDETLENAIDAPRGNVDGRYSMPTSGQKTHISNIPSALLLVGLGVATIRDKNVEIIDLHTRMHCVINHKIKPERSLPTLEANPTRGALRHFNRTKYLLDVDNVATSRGCWWQGQFYPLGYSIIDWDSRVIGHSQTAIRYRNHMQRSEESRRVYRTHVNVANRNERNRARARTTRDDERNRAQIEGAALARRDGRVRQQQRD